MDNSLTTYVERRHPEYDKYLTDWVFYKDTYDGGKHWFRHNMDKYSKEGPEDYRERVDRAYRFNHTREVVDLVNKYIFKSEIARKDDAEDYVKTFWNAATVQKRDIDSFMNMASAQASIFGRVWIVVDSTVTEVDKSQADAKASKDRIYAYTVSPIDVLDLSWNEDGQLNWIKIRECYRNDEDPFNYDGQVVEKIRIWTRSKWFLFSNSTTTLSQDWGLEDQGDHDLGIVPVTYLDHNETENPYTSTPLIADIAYLDRKAANYLSNLDAIIQDQSFSQLVIPAEAVAFADDTNENGNGIAQKLLEFGTKRIFLYHGGESGNAKPEYISPDPAQPEVILNVVNKIIGEIYHSVGMAGERTKQDNAMGIDNSSGVAKAYDFERMNAMLANKAKALQFCENRIVTIVKAWNGVAPDFDVIQDYVEYSKDFDVRNLGNEFDIAANLSIMNAPKTVRQEQMKQLVDKLWPQMAKVLRAKIDTEIDDEWLRDPTPEEIVAQSMSIQVAKGKMTETTQGGGTSATAKPASTSKTGTQGQNNKPAK